MSKRRKLTETECEVLSRNPAVKVAQPNRFVLHFEFRKVLCEYWEVHGKSPQAIREFMADHGFEVSVFSGTDIIQHLSDHFKYNGYPSNGKNTIVGEIQRFRTNAEDNTYLIGTGKFVTGRNGKGITFSKNFIEELYFSAKNTPSIVRRIQADLGGKASALSRLATAHAIANVLITAVT